MNPLYTAVVITQAVLLCSCATQQVSYRDDVVPILNNNCIECHMPPDGIGYRATGLSMASYDSLIHGTDYGPVIVAGDSRRSILNKLVEGRAGIQQRMPHNDKQGLSTAQIEMLKNWVNQGALDN